MHSVNANDRHWLSRYVGIILSHLLHVLSNRQVMNGCLEKKYYISLPVNVIETHDLISLWYYEG